MAAKTSNTNKGKPPPDREDRLKAALKANMAKRKAQARARTRTGAGPAADEAGKSED